MPGPVLPRSSAQMAQYARRPMTGSLWDRAKAVMLNSLNDPSQEVMGLSNPMAIAVVERAAPDALKAALRLKRAKGVVVPESAQPGLSLVQKALYEMADRYPRLASHFRSAQIGGMAPGKYKQTEATAEFGSGGLESLVRSRGIDEAKKRAASAGEGYFDFTINPNRVPQTLDEAREVVRHEFAHGGQTLMDPSRMDKAYDLAHQTHGYKGNPAETLARISGRRAYSSNPAAHEKTFTQLITGKGPRKVAQEAWRQARESFQRQGVNSPSSLPPTRQRF